MVSIIDFIKKQNRHLPTAILRTPDRQIELGTTTSTGTWLSSVSGVSGRLDGDAAPTKLWRRRKIERGPLRTCIVHRRHLHRSYPIFLPYPRPILSGLSHSYTSTFLRLLTWKKCQKVALNRPPELHPEQTTPFSAVASMVGESWPQHTILRSSQMEGQYNTRSPGKKNFLFL